MYIDMTDDGKANILIQEYIKEDIEMFDEGL